MQRGEDQDDDNSAAIDAGGLVTAANRGEAFVMARFETKTVGSQVIVLPAGAPAAPPATNFYQVETETKDKFAGLSLGARTVQIADGSTSTYFLTTFGRSPRETVCAAEVKTEPTLSQALHLLNGDTIQQKISAGGAVVGFTSPRRVPRLLTGALKSH